MRLFRILIIIVITSILLVSGCARKNTGTSTENLERNKDILTKEIVIPEGSAQMIYFFFPEIVNSSTIPVYSSMEIGDFADVRTFIDTYFKYSKLPDYTYNIYKPEYFNSVKFVEGLVTIDLSDEFFSEYNLRPGQSSLLWLDSLTKTLAQHPEIKEILVTIRGEKNVFVSSDGIEFGRIIINPTQRIVNYYSLEGNEIDMDNVVTIFYFIPELLDYQHLFKVTDSSGKGLEQIIQIDEYDLIPISIQFNSKTKDELIKAGLTYLIGDEVIQYNNLVPIFSPETRIKEIVFSNDEVSLNLENFQDDKNLEFEINRYLVEFFKQFKDIRKVNINWY